MTEPARVNILFVCSRNKWRSPTAETLWRKVAGVSVRSAGTANSARRRLSLSDLTWADLVFAMEDKHKRRILELSRDSSSKVRVLDIPDDYKYMDAELVELLWKPVEEEIRRLSHASLAAEKRVP